jgi:hypothetical protein
LSKKLDDEDDQRDRLFVSEKHWIAYLICSRCGRIGRVGLGGDMLAVLWTDVYQVTP